MKPAALTLVFSVLWPTGAFWNALGANIDCGCAAVGPYLTPATSVALTVRPNGVSPGGNYRVSATVIFTGIHLEVARISDSAVLVAIDLSANASWGFSPDGQAFVYDNIESQNPAFETVALYHLATNDVPPIRSVWSTSRVATSAAYGFSPHGNSGGSDLAEPLTVAGATTSGGVSVEPGMIVSIDPSGVRKFKLADEPYDKRRVGIISGGNGVKPGLVLQDQGNPAVAGDQPIALTGQVWCYADAGYGAIEPGDLLTTSATPGHAMKVIDFDKARFAVLGQALTDLKKGRGWVQVLVGNNNALRTRRPGLTA